jgi:hypothetical protein
VAVGAGGRVETTTGVFALTPASIVATASSTGKLGVCVLEGIEHDVKINNIRIIKKRLMR